MLRYWKYFNETHLKSVYITKSMTQNASYIGQNVHVNGHQVEPGKLTQILGQDVR